MNVQPDAGKLSAGLKCANAEVSKAQNSLTEVDRIFALQKAKSQDDLYPELKARRSVLKKLDALLVQNRIALCDAISADYGNRAREETLLTELTGAISNIRYTVKRLSKWMRATRRGTSIWHIPGSNSTLSTPVGVVGIMAPWNYPLHLSLVPAVAAIAAGNRVMIKMPELSIRLTALLDRLFKENFNEDQIAIIVGDSDVAAKFASLPFGHLIFTGSTAVGKKVMQAAAENLTPVTLELGGKSPVIVGPGFSLEEAACRTAWGRLFNAGQTCVAADYALVPEGQESQFANAALAAARKMYPSMNDNPDYSSIITDQEVDRLKAIVDDAVTHGATLLTSHPLAEIGPDRKFPLCILLNPSEKSRALNEETFGPILPIITYKTVSDAISYVNAKGTPLAAYYFGGGAGRKQVLRELRSGGLTLDDTLLQYLQNDLPFGGMGTSGFGQYHGKYGFDTFSHEKAIFTQRGIGSFTGAKLVYPPYGRLTHLLLKLMRKI